MANIFYKDLMWVSENWKNILILGRTDVDAHYKGSYLGYLWPPIQILFFVCLYSTFNYIIFGKVDIATVFHILSGITLWNFMTLSIAESAAMVRASSSVYLNKRVNTLFMFSRMYARHAILLSINLVLIVPFIVMQPSLANFAAIPGLFLFLIVVFFIGLIFAFLGARTQDYTYVLQVVFQAGFFLSPVIWHPGSTSRFADSAIIHYNPVYHLLNVVRAPIAEGVVPYSSIGVCILLILIFGSLSIWMYNVKSRMIARFISV